ncbi:MAG: 2-oxo acid dehydrogenase subunit E2 [Anaerolineaceae bacterium]|nr:2-oxo acid dehydrogenase subunit E2 [Anaerolineaceae bacterium]
MATQVIMPKLGESVVEGTVTAWLKGEGEAVKEFEPLLEVDTDKVSTEVPSPAGGTLLKILVLEGETVAAHTPIAWIGEPSESIPETDTPLPEQKAEKSAAEPETPALNTSQSSGRSANLGYISPVVARLAQENKVDLSQVKGTGLDGRITKKDLLAFIKSGNNQPQADIPIWETPADGDLFRPTELVFAQEKEVKPAVLHNPTAVPGETVSLSPMRRRIAEHMVMSKHIAPHVTTVMEADLSAVIAHRKAHQAEAEQRGVHLTYTPYFLSAIVSGLKAVPLANSSWTEEGIRIHAQINLGMAVAQPEGGLIVPIIRHADELSLTGLARQVNDLADRARNGALKPDEVQGGTFTLTNHGTKGSLFATPIINQPQSGILGTGMIQKRPVVINDAIAIRSMVYLSYTFDHRILDGAAADTFLAAVVQALKNWPLN